MLIGLKDTNRLSYPGFYFPPEIGQFSKWKSCSGELVHVIKYGWPCPMDCVGRMSDIGVMANHLKLRRGYQARLSDDELTCNHNMSW